MKLLFIGVLSNTVVRLKIRKIPEIAINIGVIWKTLSRSSTTPKFINIKTNKNKIDIAPI
jgi:hypothetical protein